VSPSLTSRENLYAALESEHGSAYVLGPDLVIEYVNEGWQRFGLGSGAHDRAPSECVGRAVTRFFEPRLREFFGTRFLRALQRNEPWSHIYDCSSPGEYRKFSMRAVPTAQRDALVVIHSLVIEANLALSGQRPADHLANHTDARGLVVQCSACGRVHQPSASSWNWAPWLVGSDRANVSHGICPTCDFNYGRDDARSMR
jgi:hypothetical protein